ncbi:MAG: cofactor-independent phosphoglycerate mutase, partial [Planctomycetales bacterium]|nr:cofactor-independent phosphoglycerate mutase [Planctomycetales bacterium]
AGSDVANLSLLGYDPNQHFTGRAPLEAAAQGIELGPNDWAIRCNLVTVEEQTMRDFTADHISSEEAAALLKTAQQEIAADFMEFVPGVSYRNLLLFRGDKQRAPFTHETRATPPHDLTDKSVADDFPRGPGSDLLNDLMSRSVGWFADHEVNQRRRAAGKLPATNVWLWGLGRTPSLTSFHELHGKTGKMITAVDLLRGLAALIGWDRIEVPGATGYTDTDYAAKGRYAIDALDSTDIICVHVEATDEASHEGDAAAKIAALEAIDEKIVAPLHEALRALGDYRILVSPDHPTPIHLKTHSHGFVPFAIAGAGVSPDSSQTYDEAAAASSGLSFPEGWQLMNYFLKV